MRPTARARSASRSASRRDPRLRASERRHTARQACPDGPPVRRREPGRRRVVDDDGRGSRGGDAPRCLLPRFDADGSCSDLLEYWHLEPGTYEPFTGWGALDDHLSRRKGADGDQQRLSQGGLLPKLITNDGAFMEPRGCNRWQPRAHRRQTTARSERCSITAGTSSSPTGRPFFPPRLQGHRLSGHHHGNHADLGPNPCDL